MTAARRYEEKVGYVVLARSMMFGEEDVPLLEKDADLLHQALEEAMAATELEGSLGLLRTARDIVAAAAKAHVELGIGPDTGGDKAVHARLAHAVEAFVAAARAETA